MKYRVFPLGVFIAIFYDFLALIALGLVVFPNSQKELWIWILSSIMFIALPIDTTLYLLLFSLDIVEIDDKGIKKYHFGKLKKTIAWDNLVTVKIYPNDKYQGWIILSDHIVKYNFFTSSYMMYDKKSICIKYSDKIATELEKYLCYKLI